MLNGRFPLQIVKVWDGLRPWDVVGSRQDYHDALPFAWRSGSVDLEAWRDGSGSQEWCRTGFARTEFHDWLADEGAIERK